MNRVLFFGRKGCSYTDEALAHMRRLGAGIEYVESERRGQSFPKNIERWEGEYIFCFRSFFIVPKKLLDRAAIAAINFHPAPPEYPGSGCLNFALYDEARLYGVTAHLMNEEIDGGNIVECRRFPIFDHDDIDTLLLRTHREMLDLFFGTTSGLFLEERRFLEEKLAASAAEKWNGSARRVSELDDLRTIDVGVSKEELERIIRATHTDAFPTRLRLHGYDFHLAK